MNKNNNPNKPIIGISIGDVNGIGPEVVIKALSDNRVLKHFVPIIYCSSKVISFYRKKLSLDNFNYHQIRSLDKLHFKKVNVYGFSNDNIEAQCGQVDKIAGQYALKSLEKVCQDLKEGHLDGIVTAPINKNNIQSEDFKFPGHTEYLANQFGQKESLMFMVSDSLRIGVATGHLPFKEVPNFLNKNLILTKLSAMNASLKKDFGIQKPKIAVLGLNPHAGEEGLLGKEEIEFIKPALDEFRQSGNLAFGPFPADGLFGSGQFKGFDAILAMYHDQGLIPFKSLTFEEGVNFTAGLDMVRTSPDHGTAYSLAGKNLASPNSFIKALFQAKDIINQRKESK